MKFLFGSKARKPNKIWIHGSKKSRIRLDNLAFNIIVVLDGQETRIGRLENTRLIKQQLGGGLFARMRLQHINTNNDRNGHFLARLHTNRLIPQHERVKNLNSARLVRASARTNRRY